MGVFLRDAPETPAAPLAAVTATPSNRAKTAPYNAARTITASAERIELRPGTIQQQRPFSEWQRQAWDGYEQVGEVHYGFNMLGNLLSRVRIYPGVIGEANEAPIDVAKAAKDNRVDKKLADAAQAALDDLLAKDATSMTRTFSLNMSVVGECYLIHMPLRNGNKQWTVRSVDEIQVTATGYKVVSMRGQTQEIQDLPKDTFVARIWRQNPRFSREPDSSMVGVQGSVTTLLMLERMMRGAIRSKLNAGMLFVPDGISGGLSATKSADPVLEDPSGTSTIEDLAKQTVNDPGGVFLSELIESMSTPLVDEASAANLVPMLVQGPGDLGEKIRHITFDRVSEKDLINRAENALERILNGIDIPKEIVTGLQQVKYSNAVVIDENLYKSNIEPLALTFVDSLTFVYLRAVLLGQGFLPKDVNRIVVWYDPSEIVTRPSAGDDATQGVQAGLLSPSAWRREHGFAETDAPTEEDLVKLMISKMMSAPDNVLQAMFKMVFGKVLDIEEPETQPPAAVIPIRQGQTDPNGPAADPQATAIKQVGQR